jgi:hypothetical protein
MAPLDRARSRGWRSAAPYSSLYAATICGNAILDTAATLYNDSNTEPACLQRCLEPPMGEVICACERSLINYLSLI